MSCYLEGSVSISRSEVDYVYSDLSLASSVYLQRRRDEKKTHREIFFHSLPLTLLAKISNQSFHQRIFLCRKILNNVDLTPQTMQEKGKIVELVSLYSNQFHLLRDFLNCHFGSTDALKNILRYLHPVGSAKGPLFC
jgi:hypothetical protein